MERHEPAPHAPPARAPRAPGYPEHPELPGRGEAGHAAASPGHGDHGGRHAGHGVEMFRTRSFVALALTVPTLIWSELVQELLGYEAPRFPGSGWIPAIAGTAIYAYGGWVFLQGAARELRDRLPGMMTLVALAITVAFAFSAAVALGFPGMPLWWELASLVTIMLFGHWIEMRSITQARGAVRELAKLLPATAVRVLDAGTEEVPVAELREGDLVLVRPGASVPADGEVVEGASALDEAMITGESRPVRKTRGDRVVAGTVNGSGSLRVRVTDTGERTTLAGILRLVEQAQSSRSRAQALADRAAFVLTLVAVGSGVLTLVAWLAGGAPAEEAIERVVAVLVVACPHALGLAIPLVIAISTTLAAQSGLLVRDRRGLEEARTLDVVVFDKTGTLTRGEFRVVEVTPAPGLEATRALALAAAVEADSEHPIAEGVRATARERGLSVPRASDFASLPGRGVRARVEGRDLLAGGPGLLRERGVALSPDLEAAAGRAASRGQTAIHLLEGDRVIAVLAVADAVRDESREAVARLQEAGVQVVMLTGDSEEVARAVAAELGIDEVHAEVLPDHKVQVIDRLKAQGKRVAMVGDGVNDAAALLTADVGIAIGAGTEVAVEAGDVVLVRSDPRDVPRVLELSRASYRKMMQNLVWAAGYNVVAIPLAAGVLAPWGIVPPAWFAAILMSASTVVVAANAQLLRWRGPGPR